MAKVLSAEQDYLYERNLYMDNKFINDQDANSMPPIQHKNKIGLPLFALCLDLLPVLIILLSSLVQGLSSFIILFIVFSPIAGLITGVISLSLGKGQIGILGKILAIIAIALPLAFIALIIIFYIGAVTGVISLM